MRPATLEAFAGQHHLLGPGKILANALNRNALPSLILWGPPGCGKTTLARLLAEAVRAEFIPISAVLSGVKDIRENVSHAAKMRGLLNQRTVLFVDEIHRFNKAQQDALLPHVENGTITLIGATTENPSFEVNSALLSRCRTVVLEALDEHSISNIIEQALTDEYRGLGRLKVTLDADAKTAILLAADGDARAALNTLEIAADAIAHKPEDERIITRPQVEEAVQRRMVNYDKAGEQHYNTVSAFIKSMRGGDPDAALHYMIRMLEGGEDPLFVLRRMVIFASEDVGNADPQALQVAMNATQAFQFMGMPEGVLPITQAVLYLATAPKSNTALTSYALARKDVMDFPNLPPPKHLLNAPTKLMRDLGHGRGYKYPHNFSGNYVTDVNYLPERLNGRRYYEPTENGHEAQIAQRLRTWRNTPQDPE